VKKAMRKLTLNRETLHSLETRHLKGIVGADTLAAGCATYSPRCGGGTNACSEDTCSNSCPTALTSCC
jgi:hypothetical protein